MARAVSRTLEERPRPTAERTTAPAASELPARLLELQRTVGNQAVSRLLTGAEPVSSARTLSIQRRIDPGYAAWKGGQVDSRALIGQFYTNYVLPEVTRLQHATAEEDLKVQMMADWGAMRTQAQANPFNVATAVTALNTLVASINAVADDLSGIVDRANPASEDPEVEARRERTRRTGAKTQVGTTKPGPVRGLLSAAEGTTLLTNLHASVTAGLQNSTLAIGQVGIRGSSVTGIRSRGGAPFEWGTGPYQAMSDASDHDFFFTCTGLDPLITAHGGDRSGLNSNGTMMWIYLRRFLDTLGTRTRGRSAALEFPWAVTLRDQLIAFTAAAEAITGRKSEVTYISPTGTTGAGLAADPSTVIR